MTCSIERYPSVVGSSIVSFSSLREVQRNKPSLKSGADQELWGHFGTCLGSVQTLGGY